MPISTIGVKILPDVLDWVFFLFVEKIAVMFSKLCLKFLHLLNLKFKIFTESTKCWVYPCLVAL